jgi:hypothetical protein
MVGTRRPSVIDLFKRKPKSPPVPDWKPSIRQPVDRIIERVCCYTDQKRDLVVFEHGTCVVLPDGLDDQQ